MVFVLRQTFIYFNISINSLNMVSDTNNDESLVGHNIKTQWISDNEYINANDDAISEGQCVEPSTLSEAPIYETVNRVYQLNDKMEHDGHIYEMVKKQIKERIWPYTKISTHWYNKWNRMEWGR